jgi:hypothetical protein
MDMDERHEDFDWPEVEPVCEVCGRSLEAEETCVACGDDPSLEDPQRAA